MGATMSLPASSAPIWTRFAAGTRPALHVPNSVSTAIQTFRFVMLTLSALGTTVDARCAALDSRRRPSASPTVNAAYKRAVEGAASAAISPLLTNVTKMTGAISRRATSVSISVPCASPPKSLVMEAQAACGIAFEVSVCVFVTRSVNWPALSTLILPLCSVVALECAPTMELV